jgi:hypothetical protein
VRKRIDWEIFGGVIVFAVVFFGLILLAKLTDTHAAQIPSPTQIELPCASGSAPLPGGQTWNFSTNKFRQNFCVDAFGVVTSNVVPTPISVPVRYTAIISVTPPAGFATTYGEGAAVLTSPTAYGASSANTAPREYFNAANATAGGANGASTGWWVGKNISMNTLIDLVRITDQRFWISVSDQALSTMSASDNPTGNYAGFRFSTIAGDTHWVCVTKNGTTQTIVDSLVTPIASKSTRLGIIFNDTAGNIQFLIEGNIVATITTTLPTPGTSLEYVFSEQTAVNNTGAGFEISQIFLAQDGHI